MNKIIFFSAFLSLPVLAANEDPQFFIGAKGGYQWASDDSYNHSAPSASIWGVYGGVQFTPAWSWDLGYQYHDDLKADDTSISVETWLIESALRYDWYLQENLSLYGRLGATYWDMEKAHFSLKGNEANGFSPLGEMGINYNLTPNFSLSASYQYIDSIGKSNTGKYDSQAALLSLSYRFGRSDQTPETETMPVIENTSAPEESTIHSKPQPQTSTFSTKTTEGRFGFNAINIDNSFAQSLTKIAEELSAHPSAQAVVVGHTDSTGPEAYNQTLSEQRAQAVVNKFIGLGVAIEQVKWRGEGESTPIADNSTPEGRAKNRRVEITTPNFQPNE